MIKVMFQHKGSNKLISTRTKAEFIKLMNKLKATVQKLKTYLSTCKKNFKKKFFKKKTERNVPLGSKDKSHNNMPFVSENSLEMK